MSTTFTVDIDNLVWTDISQGNVIGFFTNQGDRTILYRQSDTQPASSVNSGHRLDPASDAVNFSLAGIERIYARSLALKAQVIVTP